MNHDFKKLKIWQKSRELNTCIYTLTSKYPDCEKYNLISQMRRASISISSNISEGSSYESTKMVCRFINIALGSICELESQLFVSLDLGYLKDDQFDKSISQIDHLKRMILSFRMSIYNREVNQS